MAGVGAREAAASGEEYELLLAAPDEFDTGAFADRFGLPLTRIGSVTGLSRAPEVVFQQGGVRVDLAGGYDHFSV